MSNLRASSYWHTHPKKTRNIMFVVSEVLGISIFTLLRWVWRRPICQKGYSSLLCCFVVCWYFTLNFTLGFHVWWQTLHTLILNYPQNTILRSRFIIFVTTAAFAEQNNETENDGTGKYNYNSFS